jgi:hypothetical protein
LPLAWSEVGSDDGLSEDSLIMMMEWRKREYFAAADAGVAGMPARLGRANPLERARAALLGLRSPLGLLGAILVTAVVSAVIAASISVAVTVHLLAPQHADAGAIADRNGPLDATPSASPVDGGVAVVVASATVGLDAGPGLTDEPSARRPPPTRRPPGPSATPTIDPREFVRLHGRSADSPAPASPQSAPLMRLRARLPSIDQESKSEFLAECDQVLGERRCPAYAAVRRAALVEGTAGLARVVDVVELCTREVSP